MEFKDYYRILGVDREADSKAIGEAFRRLARQYHPDVNKDPQAAEKFKEINEAYQVLSDPEKRARYDQMLELRERGMPWESVFTRPGGGRTEEWTVRFGEPQDLFGGFSEFFRTFFVGLGMEPFDVSAPWPSSPRSATAEISLEEAFRGTERELLVRNGFARRVRVRIPPGVRTGQKVRVRGAGDGDVLVEVRVQPHPVFTREGDDLICEVPVSLTEALLGAEIEVPTLEGKVKVRVPPETQHGQVLRLRGLGMPKLRGGRGDLLVRLKVVLPRGLSPEERRLVEQLARLRRENPRASMGLK
ncbi:MAG: hypothetical protein C4304_04290 [candidate division GAL15 bacterium]